MQDRMFFKLLILGGVSILMLVALKSIGGVTHERKERQLEVEKDIASSYAGPQLVVGPFVVIDYQETWLERQYNDEKNLWYDQECSAPRSALFYPETLFYDGNLAVQERYRGIFKANVFRSTGQQSGVISFPDQKILHTQEKSIVEPTAARVCMLISDPRGIASVSDLKWGEQALKVEAGSRFRDLKGIRAEINDVSSLWNQEFNLALDLDLNGTGQIRFVPLGSTNRYKLASAWPHPSFIGDFLATNRSVSDTGFSAEWNVNELACSARQELSAGQFSKLQAFGVALIDPVNPYPMTDRALKYGFLFIFITFAAFFLFELIRCLKIHPIQYGFVGLAQALFFLLLLSLSEHIGFGVAYLVGTLATVGLISVYLCSVLKGLGRGLLFGGILSVLYAVLYGLLQSEDHALVAGTVLLFSLLALIMLLTRKVDWYNLDGSAKQ
ncbi:cell envelope integrity protein CreD [Tichowtungia aerotolerans]|uniref:Cell envelope integrity protein CreD n=1 Tax=Tichowtungia aerotolerans TaxID=2697043 RepID=A0A6P1MCX6_9BACT|nr:cell envelope integrity protein CreD [Tichowtungia aerotolerans]QHI68945.1 cell envelope integrity protein CreD [Tichowtungia aerotolerans]